MTEVRVLDNSEIEKLIFEAPLSETKFIRALNTPPSLFFKNYAIEQKGIVINNKPIYLAAILWYPELRQYALWTVVNKDVKEQFSLYKISKRTILGWGRKYKPLFATMYKDNPKNIRWTERLGFQRYSEDNETIDFIYN